MAYTEYELEERKRDDVTRLAVELADLMRSVTPLTQKQRERCEALYQALIHRAKGA